MFRETQILQLMWYTLMKGPRCRIVERQVVTLPFQLTVKQVP